MAIKAKALAAAVAVLAFVLLALTTRSPAPVFDETEYLTAARNLYHHGTISMAAPDASSRPPTAIREPGYPVLLALVMVVDPEFREFDWRAMMEGHAARAHAFDGARYANSALIVLAALLVFAIARNLGGPAAGWIAYLLVLLNAEANEMRYGIISDYLALALTAGATLLAIEALRRKSIAAAAAAGATLAALILTKAIFLYLFYLLAAGGVVYLVVQRPLAPRIAVAGLAFFLAAGVPTTAWMARNAAEVGDASLTIGRGALALSERVAWNRMTRAEYPMAYLWWTRDFGDNLARRYFKPEAYARFEDGKPGAFYPAGHDEGRALVARLMSREGLSRSEAAARVTSQRLDEIAGDLPWHLAVTVALAYRGIWIDQFVWLGLPAFIWLVGGAIRRRDGPRLALALPALYCIAIYALLSSSYPRYDLPAIPAFAVAAALAVIGLAGWLIPRINRRREILRRR
ncbi:MAG: hypothetical protein QF654_10395 [Alphaproteobacteria bacterium]|nr:hypothetical protein [Alphaproteobacteria bacterium]